MQFKWLCSGFPGLCGHVHPLQLTPGVQATNLAGCCRYKDAPVSSCARASLQTVVILLMEYVEKSVLGDFGLSSFSFGSNTMHFFVWFVCENFFSASNSGAFPLLDLFLSSISLFRIDLCRYEGSCQDHP